MNKPSVFIGSSTEGLPFARPIRTQLADVAEISLWNEGFFGIGSTFIETLVNSLPRFDFAILVLTPDDLVQRRSDENTFGPRDNVIFELGLFMGKLGRPRTFIVQPSDASVKIPSDLSGMTTAKYQWPRNDQNYAGAVGTACDAIRQAISDLGVSEHRLSDRVHDVTKEQQKQAVDINRILDMLINLIITEHELHHLQGLNANEQFIVDINRETAGPFQNELRRLIALQLIGQQPGKRVNAFFAKAGKRDAKEFFFITDSGREYLAFRERGMLRNGIVG